MLFTVRYLAFNVCVLRGSGPERLQRFALQTLSLYRLFQVVS